MYKEWISIFTLYIANFALLAVKLVLLAFQIWNIIFQKVANRRGLQHQEVKMFPVTRFELAAKNKNELHVLLRYVFNELARSEPESHKRRNALASIENIQNELVSRAPCP